MEALFRWIIGLAAAAILGVLACVLFTKSRAGRSVANKWQKVLEDLYRRTDDEVKKTHEDIPQLSDQELADRFNEKKEGGDP